MGTHFVSCCYVQRARSTSQGADPSLSPPNISRTYLKRKQMVGIPGTQRGTSAPINLDKHKIKGSDEIKSPFVNFNECKFQFI